MSTINLRPRRPLDPLPLSQFTGLPLPPPPSPISLPNKRSLISSPGRIGESSTSSKHRKVSGEHEGQETIRRKKSDITPRAKRALAEDELGTGKSPARRLFVDEGIRYVAPTSRSPTDEACANHQKSRYQWSCSITKYTQVSISILQLLDRHSES